ncbi:MAG: hypothetical protein WBN23_15915 [Woeseia sp.]
MATFTNPADKAATVSHKKKQVKAADLPAPPAKDEQLDDDRFGTDPYNSAIRFVGTRKSGS